MNKYFILIDDKDFDPTTAPNLLSDEIYKVSNGQIQCKIIQGVLIRESLQAIIDCVNSILSNNDVVLGVLVDIVDQIDSDTQAGIKLYRQYKNSEVSTIPFILYTKTYIVKEDEIKKEGVWEVFIREDPRYKKIRDYAKAIIDCIPIGNKN